jgi:hypothetical protein
MNLRKRWGEYENIYNSSCINNRFKHLRALFLFINLEKQHNETYIVTEVKGYDKNYIG